MVTIADTRYLQPEALFRRCDPGEFKFDTTAELEDLTEFAGQDRALEAVQFGTGIRRQGFNLFLLGPAGTGMYASVCAFLKKKAAEEPTLMTGVIPTTSTVPQRLLQASTRPRGAQFLTALNRYLQEHEKL